MCEGREGGREGGREENTYIKGRKKHIHLLHHSQIPSYCVILTSPDSYPSSLPPSLPLSPSSPFPSPSLLPPSFPLPSPSLQTRLAELYCSASEEAQGKVSELMGGVDTLQQMLENVSREKDQLQLQLDEAVCR